MAKPAPRRNPSAPAGDVQSDLDVYLFLFAYPVSGGQTRYFQKSVLATAKDKGLVESRLDEISEKAGESKYATQKASGPCEWRLCAPESGPDLEIGFPIDPPIISVTSDLTLAKRSRPTGTIYPEDREYCPVTGNILRPYVTAGPVESHST